MRRHLLDGAPHAGAEQTPVPRGRFVAAWCCLFSCFAAIWKGGLVLGLWLLFLLFVGIGLPLYQESFLSKTMLSKTVRVGGSFRCQNQISPNAGPVLLAFKTAATTHKLRRCVLLYPVKPRSSRSFRAGHRPPRRAESKPGGMVWVFPLPVCPNMKMVPMPPSQAPCTISAAECL